MKINMLLSGCLLGLLCFTACDSEGNEMNDYTHYVNPFIGTGGHGHTHPGAMVPHGMIQPGPDTRIDGWDSCSGYYYEDTTINGFAHTRLSGTGCADFGDFLLMPTVGVQRTDFLGTESQKRPFASAFSHEKEYAEPGYYSVFLDTYGVKAELTSTERAAMEQQRKSFTEQVWIPILINLIFRRSTIPRGSMWRIRMGSRRKSLSFLRNFWRGTA